jgi:glutaredoxin
LGRRQIFLPPAARATADDLAAMATPILYVKRGCPYCQAAKDFLDQNQISYDEVEVRSDPAAMNKLQEISGQTKTPTLVWDGEVLANFGTDELEAFLQQRAQK